MAVPQTQVMTERRVAWIVVAAATAFVAWQMYPELIVRDSTPVRSDLSNHLLSPAHLRDHVLPRGWLNGWSQAWFTGFPSNIFYFPLTATVPLVLDLLLPYNIAFKLAAALGPVTLPVAAYAFGRLFERSRLTAACYSAAMVTLVLQPSLITFGGTIGSAAIGEYAYGFSLTTALLALGFVNAGLRTGRYSVLAALCIAATGLSHFFPIVTVIIGSALLTLRRASWARVRWTASAFGLAGLLAGFWLLPFLALRGYSAGPVYPKVTDFAAYLLPSEIAPVFILAVVGLAAAAFARAAGASSKRNDVEIFLGVMAATAALFVVFIPESRIHNVRFIPCWFLWLALAAGNAVARLAALLDEQRVKAARGGERPRADLVRAVAPLALLVAILPMWDTRLGKGILTRSKTDYTAVAKPLMEGYELSKGRTQYQGFIDTLRRVARTHGCGRAYVEWHKGKGADRFPFAQQAPYWTDYCITAASGLLQHSSPTSAYIEVTDERLSADAFTLEKDPPPFDLAAGTADLRLLGIRYYIASHPKTQEAAATFPGLRLLAETELDKDVRWSFYEVPDVVVVEPLRYEPVVVRSMNHPNKRWEEQARRWYNGADEREVVGAADGPEAWARVRRMSLPLPHRPVPEASVSNVRIEMDRLTFDVSRPGVPVLVKMSYFPKWKARGADGPWRVTPNHMVVVPTSPTVTLRYERTFTDTAGVVGTVAGIGGLVLVARRPLTMPTAPEPEAERAAPVRRPQKPKRKKKRR